MNQQHYSKKIRLLDSEAMKQSSKAKRKTKSGRSAHTQVPDYLEATIYDKENAVIMASVHYCDIDIDP